MAKKDFGRFRIRGAPNGRIYVTAFSPADPVKGDIWLYPDAGSSKYFIKKQASESVASSTALQNDDDFVYNFVEPGTYEVKVSLAVAGAAAADIKIAWVASAGATQVTTRRCLGPALAVSNPDSTSMRDTQHSLTTEVSYGTTETSVGYGIVEEKFLISTAATGTLQMRWAQRVSSATATVVASNSYMTIERLKDINVASIKNFDGSTWDVLAF
jgi:hypothetical protein